MPENFIISSFVMTYIAHKSIISFFFNCVIQI